MAEIVWSDEAKEDLQRIGDYFERTSPQYARSIVQRLYDSVEPLQSHPKMGPPVPEIEHEAVRQLVREGYRIVYQLRGSQIEIVTIIHSRQDLKKKFRERRHGDA